MSDRISIETLPNIPQINQGDDIGELIVSSVLSGNYSIDEHDVLCIASKAVSIAEGCIVDLDDVRVSEIAQDVQSKIPRKDPRVVQVIIDQTGAPDGSRLELGDNYIAGWLPNNNLLTSAGVDKYSIHEVVVLPDDIDKIARHIGETITRKLGIRVGIIITDSDGRKEKAGSTQVAVGLYGVPGLRVSERANEDGSVKRVEETYVDLIAASSALLMGQRGVNKPVIVIKGLDYTFDENNGIKDALGGKK